MIELSGLRKSFGEVTAVQHVDLHCDDGKITALLGPNGAGKTTVLRMLGGLVTPDRGQVFIDGISPFQNAFAARRRLALLPDARGLYPRLTAREHIQYFGRLHGMDEAQLDEAIILLAEDLQMTPQLDRRVAGFSQGERMKVVLARALVHQPANVVLDEPTNGLDVMSARAVRQLVMRLRERGRCVVFSSHVMQEVVSLCDQIHVMAAGKIVAVGTTEDLFERTGTRDLEEAFVRLVTSAETDAPGDMDGAPA